MIRRLLIVMALLFVPTLAKANEAFHGWCELGNQSVVTSGLSSTTKVQQSNPQCTVTVFIHGGGLATLFADNNGTPLANPFQSQTNGQIIFYAANGRYDIRMSPGTTYLDWLLCDPVTGGGCGPGSGVTWYLNNALVGIEPAYDVIPGTNITITATDDIPNTRVHYTINASGGGGTGCTLPGHDTGILTEHPIGTCYNSLHATWDDGASKQVLLFGDGTSTVTADVSEVFNFGSANTIKDIAVTGLVVGDANNLWGISSGSIASELYIIGDGNNNQRNTGEAYIIGQSNGIVDVQSNHFILGNSNHFKSGTVSTQATMNHGFAVGSSNNATATPTGSLNNYGFTGNTNTINVSTGRTVTVAYLHGSQNTATITTHDDHDLYAFGTGNTFEDDLNLTEQVMSLGFFNDIDGANSTAQTLGISNTLHNVSINGGNTVVVGGVNAATTLGTIGTQYQEVFGHSNNLNNCSDCIAIGANVVETTNHAMGIGFSSTPEMHITAGHNAITGHIDQSATKNIAGTCAMGASTSCTFTLTAAFSGTPICISAVQSATLTGGASGCTVSGTTVTITAANSNSLTWGAILIGNPN